MPIPENPQSRSEQYLNAIATGDNSGLPEFPQSRMEQYLEVIAQNGGGGGGGGGVLVVHVDENYAFDKTWQEIYDAPFAVVKFGIAGGGELFHYIASMGGGGTEYTVNIRQLASDATDVVFTTNSPNGYPVYSET